MQCCRSISCILQILSIILFLTALCKHVRKTCHNSQFIVKSAHMGGAHKKKLRAEKAKVKLKGVQLPKGLNVTKTEFKVRKITIRQQAQEEPKYVEGLRIVNIKESLSRLKHNNVSNKLEALRNLRDAIENKQPDVRGHRAAIVHGIAAMCLETEQEARRQSFRTLSALLNALSDTAEIEPFFHIISSHMCCAMTHITPALQEDSLLLLDVLLKYTPQQVAADSVRILQHFLEMISRVRADGEQTDRTLLVQLKQTQTAVKWRNKVLLRLQQMLQTLAKYKSQHHANTTADKTAEVRIQLFKSNQPQYYAVKRSYLSGDHAALFVNNFNAKSMFSLDSVLEQETMALRVYIKHLMPLLLESWMEVRPATATSNSQTILNNDAACTLQIVLDIIQSLWTLLTQHETLVKHNELTVWYQKEHALSFCQNFVQSFPYQQLQQAVKAGKKTDMEQLPQTQACLRHNLSIVQQFCLFFKDNKQTVDGISNIYKRLLLYVVGIMQKLNAKHWSTMEDYQMLVLALRALLLDNAQHLLQKHDKHMLELLRSTITAYIEQYFPQSNGIAADVLVLLCEIAETPELFEAYNGEQQFTVLLQQLPLLLLKSFITQRALLAMTRLAQQQNSTFLVALEAQIPAVIQNMQRIQVSNAINALEGRRHIMNLFYWTSRSWRDSPTKLSHLQKLIQENISDKRVASYFQYILV